MIPTRNSLPLKARTSMAGLLNSRLADSVDLYSQAKQAHWNVRGGRFLTLHELFDKVSAMALEHADELAERAGQLGGEVRGTLKDAAKNTSLRPYPHVIASGEEHVEAISECLGAYGKLMRDAIDTADQAGDAGTADLFTGISRATDKMLWFVESHVEAGADSGKKSKLSGGAKSSAAA